MAKKDEFDEYDDDQNLLLDQIPKTYLLLENFWDSIETNMPRNRTKLKTFIGKYRGQNIEKLVTPYPTTYPIWTPACKKILYECTNIDVKEFENVVMTIRGLDGYKDKYLRDKAEYILALMIARWFLMHDYKTDLNILEHFIGYSHYWAVFRKFFNKFPPKPEVMKYTINEMSYKSKIKALGSVDAWLQDGVHNGIISYYDRLMRASDYELHYINEKIRGKFNSAMMMIFRAQDKNAKEKKFVFTSKSILGEDIIETSYGVAEIITIADKLSTKFFADPISETALKAALIPGGITEKDLRNTILLIADDKKNMDDVSKFYQSLIYIFLDNDKYDTHDVGTLKFYAEMKKNYKPGNTNDPNRNYIKEFLDKWLSLGSSTFRTTNRTATITTFRKSVYEYFILKIMGDK